MGWHTIKINQSILINMKTERIPKSMSPLYFFDVVKGYCCLWGKIQSIEITWWRIAFYSWKFAIFKNRTTCVLKGFENDIRDKDEMKWLVSGKEKQTRDHKKSHPLYCPCYNILNSRYFVIQHFYFWLIVFYGISTLVDYLIPNPVYSYILNMRFVNDYFGASIL